MWLNGHTVYDGVLWAHSIYTFNSKATTTKSSKKSRTNSSSHYSNTKNIHNSHTKHHYFYDLLRFSMGWFSFSVIQWFSTIFIFRSIAVFSVVILDSFHFDINSFSTYVCLLDLWIRKWMKCHSNFGFNFDALICVVKNIEIYNIYGLWNMCIT